MAYLCNFMYTCGPLWKTLKIICDHISSIRSENKGYTEENDGVSPMIGEENDDESFARVSNDTNMFLIRESDFVQPIESVKCCELWQKNGYIKNGIAKTSYTYGTIEDFFFWLRRKSEDLNQDEHSDGYLLNKKFSLTATKKPESGFTKEDMESNLIELPSRDEIDGVLRSIRDFLFQELSDQRPETQNEKMEQSEKERLEKRITSLELEAKQSLDYKEEVNELKKEVDILSAKIDDLEQTLTKNGKELEETLLQLGSLSVEHTKMLKENKMNEKALMKVHLKETSTQSVQTDLFESSYSQSSSSKTSLPDSSLSETSSSETYLPKSGLTVRAESVEKPDEAVEEEPGAVGKSPVSLVKVSKEESSDREGIRLGNVPTTAVERSLYNNYKFLLLIMAQRLLSSDVVKLKAWAEGTFSIDDSRDEIDIFWKLDRLEIISASNLTLLREFFVKILRIDLAHLIDCFMRGNYSLLRNTNYSFPRNGSAISNGCLTSRSPNVTTDIVNPRREPTHTWNGKNVDFTKPVEVKESFVVDQSVPVASRVNYHSPVPPCRGENPSISQRNVRGVVVSDGQAYNIDGARNRAVEQKEQGRTTESRTPVECRAINHGSKPSCNIGSNGQKHSKFQREDSQRNSGHNPQDSDVDSDDDANEQWLCNHYKRRCHVKFACCNKYWPCHRCHNNESNCGQRKLKSIHTKFVKCTKCDTDQEFSERSQFCINCHNKFAKYFCPTCKHLTGKDDKPYHCAKCGICRIHKHRSFHCDVCGVCLDVQLRDNHKCRAGSAHDECCICLEDAFSGCQILPCSHKVHKECATQMIRSGITCCPICRESFAHKLEKRRPARPDLRKHIGK